MSSAAHHPALCLLDIWLDLHLGLLGKEPSLFLLDLEWSTLCVSILHVCVYLNGYTYLNVVELQGG